VIGGLSHSVVTQPKLAFPKFIHYGPCETFAEGTDSAESKVVTLRTSVSDVRITTSPSPIDQVPNVLSISFQAERLSAAIRSVYPQKGQPSFEFLSEPETTGMSLVLTPITGPPAVIPLRLEFDKRLMSLGTMGDLDREFLTNREFFDEYASRFQTRESLEFEKSKTPRTVHGYVFFSIVKRIFRGDQVIEGNVLVEKGFGTIYFAAMVANDYSRRMSLVRIQMGSDPEGESNFSGVDANGIWN
jgi:hypothetical protein